MKNKNHRKSTPNFIELARSASANICSSSIRSQLKWYFVSYRFLGEIFVKLSSKNYEYSHGHVNRYHCMHVQTNLTGVCSVFQCVWVDQSQPQCSWVYFLFSPNCELTHIYAWYRIMFSSSGAYSAPISYTDRHLHTTHCASEKNELCTVLARPYRLCGNIDTEFHIHTAIKRIDDNNNDTKQRKKSIAVNDRVDAWE